MSHWNLLLIALEKCQTLRLGKGEKQGDVSRETPRVVTDTILLCLHEHTRTANSRSKNLHDQEPRVKTCGVFPLRGGNAPLALAHRICRFLLRESDAIQNSALSRNGLAAFRQQRPKDSAQADSYLLRGERLRMVVPSVSAIFRSPFCRGIFMCVFPAFRFAVSASAKTP